MESTKEVLIRLAKDRTSLSELFTQYRIFESPRGHLFAEMLELNTVANDDGNTTVTAPNSKVTRDIVNGVIRRSSLSSRKPAEESVQFLAGLFMCLSDYKMDSDYSVRENTAGGPAAGVFRGVERDLGLEIGDYVTMNYVLKLTSAVYQSNEFAILVPGLELEIPGILEYLEFEEAFRNLFSKRVPATIFSPGFDEIMQIIETQRSLEDFMKFLNLFPKFVLMSWARTSEVGKLTLAHYSVGLTNSDKIKVLI